MPDSVRSVALKSRDHRTRVDFTSRPARRSSTSCRADSTVMLSMNSQFAVATGAWVQAAWHSMRSRKSCRPR